MPLVVKSAWSPSPTMPRSGVQANATGDTRKEPQPVGAEPAACQRPQGTPAAAHTTIWSDVVRRVHQVVVRRLYSSSGSTQYCAPHLVLRHESPVVLHHGGHGGAVGRGVQVGEHVGCAVGGAGGGGERLPEVLRPGGGGGRGTGCVRRRGRFSGSMHPGKGGGSAARCVAERRSGKGVGEQGRVLPGRCRRSAPTWALALLACVLCSPQRIVVETVNTANRKTLAARSRLELCPHLLNAASSGCRGVLVKMTARRSGRAEAAAKQHGSSDGAASPDTLRVVQDIQDIHSVVAERAGQVPAGGSESPYSFAQALHAHHAACSPLRHWSAPVPPSPRPEQPGPAWHAPRPTVYRLQPSNRLLLGPSPSPVLSCPPPRPTPRRRCPPRPTPTVHFTPPLPVPAAPHRPPSCCCPPGSRWPCRPQPGTRRWACGPTAPAGGTARGQA